MSAAHDLGMYRTPEGFFYPNSLKGGSVPVQPASGHAPRRCRRLHRGGIFGVGSSAPFSNARGPFFALALLFRAQRTREIGSYCVFNAAAANLSSLDHIVGGREQRWRNGEPKCLGGLEVDGRFVFGRRLHRQIDGLCTTQDRST
jgi:hypothetical protein